MDLESSDPSSNLGSVMHCLGVPEPPFPPLYNKGVGLDGGPEIHGLTAYKEAGLCQLENFQL